MINNSFKMNSSQGMSLIEVLIATTLLAFIMMGVISTTNNSFDTKEMIVEEDKIKVQIHTAIARMARDFQRLYSPLYYAPRHIAPKKKDEAYNNLMNTVNERYRRNDRFQFPDNSFRPVPKIISETGKDIEFLTTSHFSYLEGQNQSELAWVKYEMVRDPLAGEKTEEEKREQGNNVLIRRVDPTSPYDNERVGIDETKEHIVLENVASLTFEFWDSQNLKFVSGLRELRKDKDRFAPRAIKMILEWEAFPGEVQVIEKIFRPLFPHFEISKQEMQYLREAVDGKVIRQGQRGNQGNQGNQQEDGA